MFRRIADGSSPQYLYGKWPFPIKDLYFRLSSAEFWVALVFYRTCCFFLVFFLCVPCHVEGEERSTRPRWQAPLGVMMFWLEICPKHKLFFKRLKFAFRTHNTSLPSPTQRYPPREWPEQSQSSTSWFKHITPISSTTNAACNRNSTVTYLVSCWPRHKQWKRVT